MKITGRAEDQLAIRLLIDRYSDAVCQRDKASLASLWADEGRWAVKDMPELDSEGKAEIVARWEAGISRYSVLFLICVPGFLEIDGDSAQARSYTSEIIQTADGKTRRAAGLYEDRFVKRAGEWLFAERVWSAVHSEGDLGH